MRAKRGDDKCRQYRHRGWQKAVVGRAKKDYFDDGDQPRDLPSKLAMAQPLGKQEAAAADHAQGQRDLRQRRCGRQQIDSQKKGRPNLMRGPDSDGEIQDPVGPVTNSPHVIVHASGGVLSLCHGHWHSFFFTPMPAAKGVSGTRPDSPSPCLLIKISLFVVASTATALAIL